MTYCRHFVCTWIPPTIIYIYIRWILSTQQVLFLATSLTGWGPLGVSFSLVSPQEVFVQLLLVVVGAVLYAYVISVVAPRLGRTTASRASDEWHRQMDSMNHAMKEVIGSTAY
jgi:hypothetical protein